jgi:hypothetical protein
VVKIKKKISFNKKIILKKKKFKEFDGPVGDFLKYIGTYKAQTEAIHPCLIKDGKPDVIFETHEQLDHWHNENKESATKVSLFHLFLFLFYFIF